LQFGESTLIDSPSPEFLLGKKLLAQGQEKEFYVFFNGKISFWSSLVRPWRTPGKERIENV
jgi:hypothetical protein